MKGYHLTLSRGRIFKQQPPAYCDHCAESLEFEDSEHKRTAFIMASQTMFLQCTRACKIPRDAYILRTARLSYLMDARLTASQLRSCSDNLDQVRPKWVF